MWKSASKSCLSDDPGVLTQHVQELWYDDESSSTTSSEHDGLECPICCESFNMVKNIPYVLWCGHSLCQNCVLCLQWTVVKINSSLIQLPLLISCPWCNLFSPRLVLRGTLKFPRKNYFLLWMVEKIKSNHKVKSDIDDSCGDFKPSKLVATSQTTDSNEQRSQSFQPTSSYYRRHSYLMRTLFFILEVLTKFPSVLIFLLLLFFAIPASVANLAVFVVLTIVFALPSFLILYFSYTSVDWLAREIMA